MKHTIVMTGASRGIGRVAAERILRESPDTHLVVVTRDASGARLVSDLSNASGARLASRLGDASGARLASGLGDAPPGEDGPAVSHVEADLGSPASVRAAALEIANLLDAGDLPPLRGFVGNAGIQQTDALTEGPDGLESTFAVNVLANHLFVRLLQDHFATPARIVITTSDTHFGDVRHNLGMVPGPAWQPPEVLARPGAFPNPETATAGRTAYATSKLATIYLVHEYARRLPDGLDAVAFNPGFVPGTGLARNAGPAARFAMRRVLPALTLTPFATGRTTAGRHLADVVLGTTPAPTGSYVDRTRVAPSSPESYSPTREQALWTAIDHLTTSV